jgi:hypothetical protein
MCRSRLGRCRIGFVTTTDMGIATGYISTAKPGMTRT